MTSRDLDRQVVITGVGVLSPIGVGQSAFWQSLIDAKSGVRALGDVGLPGFPIQFGGFVDEFDPKAFVTPRKSIKLMCRETQLGMAAASLAMENAQLDSQEIVPERFGVVFGSQMLYGDPREFVDLFRASLGEEGFCMQSYGSHVLSQLFPLWLLKYLPNMGACHVGIAHNARGYSNSIVQGNVSGLLAIIEATLKIQEGTADVMIAGGIGSFSSPTYQLVHGTALLSKRNDDPSAASRPFDADRDGTVMGEGSGALILESRKHAESRGAKVLATFRGFARSFGKSMQGQYPTVTAVRRSIESALHSAQFSAIELGHINAHGLSCVDDDRVEAQAINLAAGDTPVTAPKSFFGNLGSGSGAVEAIVSVLALANKLIPPTLNYRTPDPQCPVKVVRDHPVGSDKPAALILNQAATGQAVAVVFARND